MANDENFYNEILRKKAEFESFTYEEQSQDNIFDSEMINTDITYLEVSEAIESNKNNKAFLDIPNEALKMLILHFSYTDFTTFASLQGLTLQIGIILTSNLFQKRGRTKGIL